MIIHDTITCQRIQTILALCGRACLFLQSVYLQSIYLSSYKMTTPHVTDRIRRKNGELTGFSTAGTGLLLTGRVILSLPNRANKRG